MIKIGRELGIKDSHKYTMVECPECHNERWVRIDRQDTKCFNCSRGFMGEMTEERSRNISNGQKRRIERDGVPDYFCRGRFGVNNPMFGKQQTVASVEKNRQSNKRNWESLEYQDKWAKANLYPHVKQNKPEHEIEDYLKEFGVEFVGDGKFWLGYPPRNPDFIHRKNRKIVEFFGNYWHKLEDELDRIDHYNKYGWNCFVVWESDYNTNKEFAIAKIKEFIL
ncbi:MAG: hypothetical protein KKA68_20985 [Gammaproteobacteria bacterium]|nr:hypothetical protein [Gammaproteobacteria bacterium]